MGDTPVRISAGILSEHKQKSRSKSCFAIQLQLLWSATWWAPGQGLPLERTAKLWGLPAVVAWLGGMQRWPSPCPELSGMRSVRVSLPAWTPQRAAQPDH